MMEAAYWMGFITTFVIALAKTLLWICAAFIAVYLVYIAFKKPKQ